MVLWGCILAEALVTGSLQTCLQTSLRISIHVCGPLCDVALGWRLHSVGNCLASRLDSPAIQNPKLKHGCVECVFYNYQHPRAKVCKTAARAAQLFCNAVRVQAAAPLRFLDIDGGLAAVDAFATAESGGIGGWWIASGSGCVRSKVRWFSFQINKNDLPAWFTNGCSGSLQSCIAALEAAAQLALLLARAEASQAPEKVVLKFHQLCDNAGAASAARKHLAMSEPLSFVLQATGYWCCRLGVALCPHHIAGEKNTWADDLSRNKLDGFGPALRWSVDLRHVLERPWQ